MSGVQTKSTVKPTPGSVAVSVEVVRANGCCGCPRRAATTARMPASSSMTNADWNLADERVSLRRKMRTSVPLTSQRSFAYQWNLSTRDNFQCDPAAEGYKKFTAPFADIRAQLDMSYHGVYTLERQAMQDELIQRVIEVGASQPAPWITFTAGAMGAGKSRTMGWLSETGIFPLEQV